MIRIGHGMDVHRLVPNRKLILCGIEIPFEHGLEGHSNADVAVHALIDSLLGASALGDIGKLFPDTNDEYLGIDSLILLNKVCSLLQDASFSINNIDITIIAQRPKLRPYIDAMRKKLAEVMSLSLNRVSVKATTTEHLGFEGEGFGITAHCVCLLEHIE